MSSAYSFSLTFHITAVSGIKLYGSHITACEAATLPLRHSGGLRHVFCLLFFFNFPYYRGVRNKVIWITYSFTGTIGGPPLTFVSWVQGSLPKTIQGWIWTEGHWNTEIPSPYIACNNYPLEKNVTADPGIETGTTWTEGKDGTTEPTGRPLISHIIKLHQRITN